MVSLDSMDVSSMDLGERKKDRRPGHAAIQGLKESDRPLSAELSSNRNEHSPKQGRKGSRQERRGDVESARPGSPHSLP